MAGRAREKLDAGAPLEAIHLAEVALEAAPRQRAALEVSLAAHRRLETQSENFWLSAWLRKQIAALDQQLAETAPRDDGDR